MQEQELPPLPPNEAKMSPEAVARVVERQYPKHLYHPSQPSIVVQSREQHEALGTEWVESPADLVDTPSAPEVPTSREAYYRLDQPQVLLVVEHASDRATLEFLLSSEIANPRRPNGRPVVVAAIKDRLEDLVDPVDEAPPIKRGPGRPRKQV